MNRDVVLAEWRRSARSLGAAELLSREGYSDDAVSRAYSAILHAAKAALLVHDVAVASHAGLRRMFGKHLIRTGRIEQPWTKHLAKSSDDRLTADYDSGICFADDEARLECERAREFAERIRAYLLASGLTEQELASPPPTRAAIVKAVGDAMFRERDRRGTSMSREEVRQARDEGRA